jgi:hypothetical protein
MHWAKHRSIRLEIGSALNSIRTIELTCYATKFEMHQASALQLLTG